MSDSQATTQLFFSLLERTFGTWEGLHVLFNSSLPIWSRKEVDISVLAGLWLESDASVVLPVFHCLVDESFLII